MIGSTKNIFDPFAKSEFIKQLVLATGASYVEMDIGTIYCVYDIYNIISNSKFEPENVIQKISMCDGFVSNNQQLSIICLYIGFFCDIVFEDSVLKYKIVKSYYKISSEMGNGLSAYNLAIYYCNKLSKYAAAIKYFKLSVELGCDNPGKAYFNIACCYLEIGDYDSALKYYEKSVECGHTSKDKWLDELAACYYVIGNYDEAIKIYEKALLSSPPEHVNKLYLRIGNCYDKKDDHKNTIRYYEKSLQCGNVNIAYLCCAIGFAHCQLRDYDKALEYYGKSLQNNPKDKSDVYHNIGGIYNTMNKQEPALKYFKLAYKNGSYKTWHNVANIYDKMNKPDKVWKYFKKTIGLLEKGHITPDSISYLYERIFLNHKNYDGVLAFCLIKKDKTKIVNRLNEIDSGKLQTSTIADVAIYFNENPNNGALYTFIKNCVGPKLALLDSHFNYAINSEGYRQTKEDFYKQTTKHDPK